MRFKGSYIIINEASKILVPIYLNNLYEAILPSTIEKH